MSQTYQRLNDFEEISRVKITPNQDIVFSKMIRSDGEVRLFVNAQADPSSPLQYKDKGISIPRDSLEEVYQAFSDTRWLFLDDKKEVGTCAK